jgi:hypothetical protein
MWSRLVFSLAALLPMASALYFHIGETERKCFIEEIPDETMVIGKEPLNKTLTDIESNIEV